MARDEQIAIDHEAQVADYVPPRIERLGSLSELTQGGTVGPDDGFGGAGDEGSV